MKKLIFLVLFSSILVGCGSNPTVKPHILTEIQTEYREIPSEYFVLPDEVEKIDITDPSLTQKDVSKWITKKDQRETDLEDKIKAIEDFQNKSIEDTVVQE